MTFPETKSAVFASVKPHRISESIVEQNLVAVEKAYMMV